MESAIKWKILDEADWPRLVEFLTDRVGPSVYIPNPQLSSVIVLTDDADTIHAAFSCNLQLVLGALVTSAALPIDVEDAVYASAVAAIKEAGQQNGIEGQPILALTDPERGDFMESLGFVALSEDAAFVGTV